MSDLANFVSLHPYFKIHPGKIDEIKAMLPRFVAKTESGLRGFHGNINGTEKGTGQKH